MIRAQRVRSFNPTSARHLRTKARDTGAIPIAEFSGSVFQCFGPWADGACCKNPRATSQPVATILPPIPNRMAFHTINQARPLSVQIANLIIAPLADNAIIIGVHRCQHRARAAAYAIATLAFAFGRPANPIMHDRAIIVRRASDDPVRARNPVII